MKICLRLPKIYQQYRRLFFIRTRCRRNKLAQKTKLSCLYSSAARGMQQLLYLSCGGFVARQTPGMTRRVVLQVIVAADRFVKNFGARTVCIAGVR